MFSGNKGEWSEIYTLVKLLADGKVYAADSKLNKITGLYYPILKIIRRELDNDFMFSRESKIMIKNKNGVEIASIEIETFKQQAAALLELIKNKSGRSFTIPEIEPFLKNISCKTLKAKHSKKRDITLIVHDPVTLNEPELGFSIKSKLGGDSTLLNASKSTNFIYEVKDAKITNSLIKEINNISSYKKIFKRVDKIYEIGGSLEFKKVSSDMFYQNMTVIDSMLPKIISELILLYYKGVDNYLSNLIHVIKKENPCNFQINNNHPFYEYKIKQFLNDVALGLTPTTMWTGMYDATGGYLIVREDGEILCYHVYNMNNFQNYLLNNTRFETPSSSRHNFGIIYPQNGRYLFKSTNKI